MNPKGFNLKLLVRLDDKELILFQAFNRDGRENMITEKFHYWGFGILQIGRRHLFYVGYNAVSILFIGQSK